MHYTNLYLGMLNEILYTTIQFGIMRFMPPGDAKYSPDMVFDCKIYIDFALYNIIIRII